MGSIVYNKTNELKKGTSRDMETPHATDCDVKWNRSRTARTSSRPSEANVADEYEWNACGNPCVCLRVVERIST